MAYTLEQYQAALDKAKAANDTEAVNDLSQRINSAKLLNGYDKAVAAKDIPAVDDLAQRYRASRPQWSRDEARRDPMWIKNAKTIYKNDTGKDFSGTDEEAGNYLLGLMSDFNYRLVGLGSVDPGGIDPLSMVAKGAKALGIGRGGADIAAKVKDFSPEGKSAFISAMDDFDALPDFSAEGTLAAAGRTLSDPSTYAGLGSFGLGTGAAQSAKLAAKEGLKEALKFGLKQTAKAAGIASAEGAVSGAAGEAERQTAEINANRRQGYDPEAIGKSGAVAGAISAPLGVLGRVADVGTVARGANRLATDDKAAAGRLASRLDKLSKQDSFDLKNVDDAADHGAKQAVGTAHTQIAQEASDNARLLRDRLDPQQAKDTADFEKRTLAQQALRATRTKEKASASQDAIDALDSLVGDTQEGRNLVDLVKEGNELTRVNNRGVKGGISQYTDELVPFFGKKSRFLGGDQALRAAVTGYAGFHTGGMSLAAQLGGFAGGRLVDAATGNRALVNKFVKQNLPNFNEGNARRLPSVLDAKNTAKAQADDAKSYKENLKQLADKLSFQRRMEKQLQNQTDQLVETRTDLNKQRQASEKSAQRQQMTEQKAALQEQAKWQRERQRLLDQERRAKTQAERQKAQQDRASLDTVYKQMRIKQAFEKQQAAEAVKAMGGVAQLRKVMKPLGKVISEKAGKAPAAAPQPKTIDSHVRIRELYEAGKARNKALEIAAEQTAEKAPTQEVRDAIKMAVADFRNAKQDHTARMEAYRKALASVGPDYKQFVQDTLYELANVANKRKKKK